MLTPKGRVNELLFTIGAVRCFTFFQGCRKGLVNEFMCTCVFMVSGRQKTRESCVCALAVNGATICSAQVTLFVAFASVLACVRQAPTFVRTIVRSL